MQPVFYSISFVMPPIKSYLFLLIILVGTGFTYKSEPAYLAKWVITKGCSLKVAGSTNVNKFACDINNYYKPDTLTFFKTNQGAIPVSGVMKLDLIHFDCHHPMMTSDLRKTLKAKEFPVMTIKFISISKYPDGNNEKGAVTGMVNIELAGKTRRYEVDYSFKNQGNNTLTLVGKRRVHFSDFGIVPPRKIGGMIQTNNELDITFNLNIRILK